MAATAIVMGIYFVVGCAVGVIVVVALPVLRGPRSGGGKRHDQGRVPSQRGHNPATPEARDDRDVTVPDDRPRWPGDGGHGYYRG